MPVILKQYEDKDTLVCDLPPSTPGTGNVGYQNIPQNSQSANYTTVLTDSGKCLFHPVGDANARTFTIDSNANVAYPIGTVIMVKNNSASDVTISSLDTLTLDGTGDIGFFTLSQYGKVTAMKETSTGWSIGGVNLTYITPVAFTLASEIFATLDTAGASGTGTLTFDAVVSLADIAFYDVNTHEYCGGTITITGGFGTDTLSVSYTTPPGERDISMKGTAKSSTGYSLSYESTPYTLF